MATGLLPKEFGKRIARLFRERQTGDYGFGISITEADAREDINHARIVVDAAENWLASEGHLPQPD